MRFGTALSIPSVFTAVTNCWCSSADHTTRGFFRAEESSWPSSFFPFSSPRAFPSPPFASSSRANPDFRERFFVGSSPMPFERPGLPVPVDFEPFRAPFPALVFLCAPREPSSDPLRRGVGFARPALAPSAPPSTLLAHDVLPDVAQLLDAHGLEQVVDGTVDDPAQHDVRRAVGAHHHHRTSSSKAMCSKSLNPSMSGMCTSDKTMSKSWRRSRRVFSASAPRVKVVTGVRF